MEAAAVVVVMIVVVMVMVIGVVSLSIVIVMRMVEIGFVVVGGLVTSTMSGFVGRVLSSRPHIGVGAVVVVLSCRRFLSGVEFGHGSCIECRNRRCRRAAGHRRRDG